MAVINRELTKATIQHYGWEKEAIVVVEELSELTKEVCKMERGIGNLNNLVEEIADVCIVISLLIEHYHIEEDELQQMIASKESRNRRRLGDCND